MTDVAPDPRPADVEGPDPIETNNGQTANDPDVGLSQDPNEIYEDVASDDA